MQRYTFQLSVGNRISERMDAADDKHGGNDAEQTTPKDTVKNIAEMFDKHRNDTEKDLKGREPIYTLEEEEKLIEKYKSKLKGKLDAYVKFFKNADTENLGFLTIHQFAAAVRKRGFDGRDSQIATMFVDINKNMDWEMTFEEFLDEMSRKDAKLRTEAEMLEIFRTFDHDKDGFISRQELQETVERFRKAERNKTRDKNSVGLGLEIDLDAVMKRSDKDGDGKISFEDFMKSCVYRDKVNGK